MGERFPRFSIKDENMVQEVIVKLRSLTCGGCGVVFGIVQSYYNKLAERNGSFYCPNGCSRMFCSETDAQKLEKELIRERKDKEMYIRRAERLDRARASMKGVVTRIRNRIANGVCPCCNRHFKDLHRHMTSKHPDYSKND